MYHASSIENIRSIIENGILPDEEGRVFICTRLDLMPTIVRNQLFLDQYALFQISDFDGEIHRDMVAESTAPWQWILVTDKPIKANLINCFALLENIT